MHKPVFLKQISLYFTDIICFEDFSAQIQSGSRIVITGNNGSGKSSLLKIIKGDLKPSSGEVIYNGGIVFGYVPQIIDVYENLSGGEQFNKALSSALADDPGILLLDEPTNHLDAKNRKSLIRMLDSYSGTLVTVSHDEELLRNSVNAVWNIRDGKIDIFNGNYDDYIESIRRQRQALSEELHILKKDKKETHLKLMKEQERAKKSKERGEKLSAQKRWLPALVNQKASDAGKTAGARARHAAETREVIQEGFSGLNIPKIIRPKFSLPAKETAKKMVLLVSGGSVKYGDKLIANNINISVSGGEHLAITGANGSGKTTLFKAILNYPEITKEGEWHTPKPEETGFLDQHYGNLDPAKTVFETLAGAAPEKSDAEIRDFLSDFLFQKNGEVHKAVSVLSGGERARLSLAKIALKTPRLLLIDEITNNIDLETKNHVTEVLREYPGTMVIISHENSFLQNLHISHFYEMQ